MCSGTTRTPELNIQRWCRLMRVWRSLAEFISDNSDCRSWDHRKTFFSLCQHILNGQFWLSQNCLLQTRQHWILVSSTPGTRLNWWKTVAYVFSSIRLREVRSSESKQVHRSTKHLLVDANIITIGKTTLSGTTRRWTIENSRTGVRLKGCAFVSCTKLHSQLTCMVWQPSLSISHAIESLWAMKTIMA